MYACLTTTGLMQQIRRLFGVLVVSIFSCQMAAHAAPAVDGKKVLRAIATDNRIDVGSKMSLRTPSANPYALSAKSGTQTVQFSVPVRLAKTKKSPMKVFLRRRGDKQNIEMNDLGKNGDYLAKDGIFGVNVQIDTSRVEQDTCLVYEAFAKGNQTELVSPPLLLCVSSFPVRVTTPNIDKPVVFDDGVKAVADEVLLYAKPTTSAVTIRELASSINATIVGSIIPLNLYQLKLPAPVSATRLQEIVAQLNTHTEIAGAAVNALGHPAGHVDNATDPEFASQDGVKLVLKHPALVGNYVWDAGAIGTGQTVVVADYGLDRMHPDFGVSGDCQLSTAAATGVANTDCGGTNNDNAVAGVYQWHGTRVAGVLSAKALNGQGIAGVAHGSKIYSYKVTSFAVSGIAQIFIDMGPLVTAGASVINASFSGGPWNPTSAGYMANINAICTAVNTAVSSGSGAIVVIAAGNTPETSAGSGVLQNPDSWYYPARCNEHANVSVANRSRIIVVGNSTSVVTANCGSVALDQLCAPAVPFNANLPGSNYGAWVNIAAPGSDIRTTTSGGYTASTGTSFSTPIVSGAVAILKSCGVPLDSIKSTLTGSAGVKVHYPTSAGLATDTPRLDVYSALSTVNHAPTGVGLSNNNIYEKIDTSAGFVVGTLSAVDVDTCDKLSFSIVGGIDMPSFSIDPVAKTLILTAGVLNRLAHPSYTVIVRATDFFGATVDQSFTVNVINVNDSPAGTSTTVTTNEDTTYTFSAANFGFTDPLDSPPNNLSEVIITTVPAVGQLKLGAAAVAAGQHVAAANLGNLTFMPASQANGLGYASFTFQVVDDGGVANGGDNTDHTPNTLTINVTPVNDAPVNTVPAAQTATEGVAKVISGISVFDVDAGAAAITMSLTATHGTISVNTAVAGGVSAANITGNNTASIILTGSQSQINATLANATGVTYTASLGGSASLTVMTNDNGASGGAALSDTDMIAITVTAGNHPPTIAPQSFNHIEYDQITPSSSFDDFVGIVNASDPDIGDTLTFIITAGNDDAVVNGVPQLNAFKFDPAIPGRLMVNNHLAVNFEYQPVFNLIVQVSDGTLSATAPVTVNLTNDTNDQGDPHINAVGGLHYDFQSAGEFVALRGTGMEIQTRQTPVSTAAPIADSYSGLPVGVSVNTAVAARVGKHSVTYQMKDNANSVASGLELKVDHVVATATADGFDLGSGGRVAAAPGGGIQIDFPDGTTLIATPNWWAGNNVWYLNLDVFHTTAREGIMGARYKGSWLPRLSDGSALGAMPAAMHDRYVELYVKFADSWRVNDETSLFDYALDTSTKTFTFKEWPKEDGPYVIGNGPVAKPLARNVATKLCRGVVGKNEKADCVFDVMVTGNRGIAKSHLFSQQIRTGLTSISVRDDRGISRDKEMVTFTATVARHAAITRKEIAGKGVRGVPTGAVQFTINGNSVGKPVKLDARGQAQLKMPRLKIEKQTIGAKYIPVKGGLFFPSSSRQLTREFKPLR